MAGRPREDWRAGSSRTATGGIVCAESRLGGSFSSASPQSAAVGSADGAQGAAGPAPSTARERSAAQQRGRGGRGEVQVQMQLRGERLGKGGGGIPGRGRGEAGGEASGDAALETCAWYSPQSLISLPMVGDQMASLTTVHVHNFPRCLWRRHRLLFAKSGANRCVLQYISVCTLHVFELHGVLLPVSQHVTLTRRCSATQPAISSSEPRLSPGPLRDNP